jgi:hypothetical protein
MSPRPIQRTTLTSRRRRPDFERLGERCLLSADPLMPSATTTDLSQVFFVGDQTTPAPPEKTVTITNNSGQTIFPILRDANTGSIDGVFYDPKDLHNREYRGYIGYQQGGTNYLGLPAHRTITFSVPLVFWDGTNLYIATDGRDMVPAGAQAPNPFEYNPASIRSIAGAVGGNSGLVMWYTVKDDLAHTPTPDAPAQLTEFTIRDPYLARFNVPGSQTIKLINYDVSYVDSNLLSVAMEATSVPIPNTAVSADYGWIGSTLDQGTLQTQIGNFVANTGDELGRYFDGNGWPAYYAPPPSPGGLKIPSGANVFANSPLNDTRSKYDNLLWALSSGGPGPIEVFGTGVLSDPAQPNVIHLSFQNAQARDAFFAVLADGRKAHEEFDARTTISPDVVLGKVISFAPSATDPTGTVTLDKNANLGPNEIRTFDFFRPVTDYASTRIRDIWYAWAKYYVDTFTGSQQTLAGAVASATTNALKLNSDPRGAVALGMTVGGAGIRPGTTVLGIDKKDPTKIYLSQLPLGTGTGSYTFNPPTPMVYADEANPLSLTFAAGADTDTARKFAGSVYEALAAEAAIPIPLPPATELPKLPRSMVLVSTAIGCDVLHLPNHDDVIGGQVRDLIKSVLRGVYDFTQVPESKWYPDPSVPTGGRAYNVFNLDPYVWFVHKKLGLSGYGFSVDDDTADVGANGSDSLLYVVSGNNGLKNTFEWFPSLPWGQITALAKVIPQANGPAIIQLLDATQYQQIRPDDPANSVAGAFVRGPGIPAGTNLQAFGLLDQLQFFLSSDKVTSSNGQFVELTFTGKNLPPLRVGKVPVVDQLVAAADRFETRAESTATVRDLRRLEAAYVRDARTIALATLRNARLPRAVRQDLRQFTRLTAALNAEFRQSLGHRVPLQRLIRFVRRYEGRIDKLQIGK